MTSERVFFGVSALFFAASAALTIIWCASMQAMGGMPMPGGWTMSMTWMRMPGHSWPGSAASFLAMWTAMMVAMMLPSLVPMLLRYRAAVATNGGTRLGLLTVIAGAGYFFVWTVVGITAFAVGVTLAAIEMQQATVSRTVPIVGAVIVLIAGSLQFTRWKARHLSRCRETGHDRLPATAFTALRDGISLGLRCVSCCANLTVILLVIGLMDLRAMAVVTAAITAERFSRSGEQVARVTGTVIIAAGVILIVAADAAG